MPVKSEETRERILNEALELFRRNGFEKTTMREIAAEAGVALGSAYYYFASKEALVMAFYERASDAMFPRIEEALESAKGLEERLRVILQEKFDYFGPNRAFLGALSGSAADPENDLSPFSKKTAHIRARDVLTFAAALEGTKVPKDLAPHLPGLLWTYQMGLILFWTYDRSPGQRRTQKLREKSLAMVVTAIKVAGFSLMKPLRKRVVDLIEAVEEE